MADMVIGVPSFGTVSIQFAMSLTSIAMPLNFSNQFQVVLGKPIDVARNEIVDATLMDAGNPRYLAFLDDDVIMPPDSLRKLLYRLENSPPSVGAFSGVYFSKSDPAEPLIFKERARGSFYDWSMGDVFPCWAAGCGLVVIRVECLRRMLTQHGRPHFKVDYGLTKLPDGRMEARSLTEDLYFYTKLGKTVAPDGEKYRLMIDTSIQAVHFDSKTGKGFGLKTEDPQAQGRRPIHIEGKQSLLWVGFGGQREDLPGYHVITTDEVAQFAPDIVTPGNLLPSDDGQFDRLYSAYLLHSFAVGQVPSVLREWHRVLRPGGLIHIKVPAAEAASKLGPEEAKGILSIGKSAFTAGIMKHELEQAGFGDVVTFTAGESGEELNAMGRKA